MIPPFLEAFAERSANPALFLWGLGVIYATAAVLLVAVVTKFRQHALRPQPLKEKRDHPFSTLEMTLCAAVMFPFWTRSWGQMPVEGWLQYAYFGVGLLMAGAALAWHLRAKVDIGTLWSDGIEIKAAHPVLSSGAFALARHPMYASLLMWSWGASLMMMNAATLAWVTFAMLPLMIFRAKAEERLLTQANPDYRFYWENVRMLFPGLSGAWALVIKLAAIGLLAACIWEGITFAGLLLLIFTHLYLGYSLLPEKVAFSYRSKSGMMAVFWALSLLWPPVYYLFYLVLLMFVYGLKFNCPCMRVYDKYQGCPCFALLGKCVYKGKPSK